MRKDEIFISEEGLTNVRLCNGNTIFLKFWDSPNVVYNKTLLVGN